MSQRHFDFWLCQHAPNSKKLQSNLFDSFQKVVDTELLDDAVLSDLTSSLLSKKPQKACVITKEPMVLCGLDVVFFVLKSLKIESSIEVEFLHQEGDFVNAFEPILILKGEGVWLNCIERTLLNFIQTLSGVSTRTQEISTWIKGSSTKILDTRKTIPSLRWLQKYAVLVGGGYNHRLNLSDAILIKENHIIHAGGSIENVLKAAKKLKGIHQAWIEIEVETQKQLEEVLDIGGVDRIMLDNWSDEKVAWAVEKVKGRVPLEVSGLPFEKERIQSASRLGVDYISLGALTKHLRAIDLSMRFED